MTILKADEGSFTATVPVIVVGGGASGMCAALAATDAGAEVVVLERDSLPAGSTALSSGMIPAAGTRLQKAAGVDDDREIFAADIMAKAGGLADPGIVAAISAAAAPTVDWLVEKHRVDLELVGGFLYPGHSRLRMHAPPDRDGATLMAFLLSAVEAAGIDVLIDAHVTNLFADEDGRVRGVRLSRPDGSGEDIACDALVLACCGFGGNKEMVRRHLPEMADALYFGHPGNQGDGIAWGTALGAEARHMTAYQGHASVAHPHSILISWALMGEGAIQINRQGRRFSNEHQGYSEQSLAVLAEDDHLAWNIFDQRLHRLGLDFGDYRQAETAGAIRSGATAEDLATELGLPARAVSETIAGVERYADGLEHCPFGRDFTTKPALRPPYFGVRVTGALFHTQGGLRTDHQARVLRPDASPLPNLFAGGGTACGVSGPHVWGYLSGNGLLTATTLGRLAGTAAADLIGE